MTRRRLATGSVVERESPLATRKHREDLAVLRLASERVT